MRHSTRFNSTPQRSLYPKYRSFRNFAFCPSADSELIPAEYFLAYSEIRSPYPNYRPFRNPVSCASAESEIIPAEYRLFRNFVFCPSADSELIPVKNIS